MRVILKAIFERRKNIPIIIKLSYNEMQKGVESNGHSDIVDASFRAMINSDLNELEIAFIARGPLEGPCGASLPLLSGEMNEQ